MSCVINILVCLLFFVLHARKNILSLSHRLVIVILFEEGSNEKEEQNVENVLSVPEGIYHFLYKSYSKQFRARQ